MIIDNSIVDRQGITFLDGGSNQWLACKVDIAKKNSRESARGTRIIFRFVSIREIRGWFALASS